MCRTEYVNNIQVVLGVPHDARNQICAQLDFGFQPLEGIERAVASVLLEEEAIVCLVEQLQSALAMKHNKESSVSEDQTAEDASLE